jgi:hypothetical protein
MTLKRWTSVGHEDRLFRVTSPYYVAGFAARRTGPRWTVHKAAPVLRWVVGLELDAVKEWFAQRSSTYLFEEINSTGSDL